MHSLSSLWATILLLDFVTLWKPLSTLLAGGFGLLGLLTKFKEDSGKITKWGKVSFVGIIFSTFMGALVQITEATSVYQASVRATKEKEADQKIALETVKQTQIAVSKIERLLHPIAAPIVRLQSFVRCQNEFEEYCQSAQSYVGEMNVYGEDRHERLWTKWPTFGGQAKVRINVDLMQGTKELRKRESSDWHLSYEAEPTIPTWQASNNYMKADAVGKDRIFITTNIAEPSNNVHIGVFQSLLDLDSSTIYVTIFQEKFVISHRQTPSTVLMPHELEMLFPNGRRVILSNFREVAALYDTTDKTYSTVIKLPGRE